MNLDEQIQQLINDAPLDGVTPRLILAIAPGLKLLASRLRHLQYYILQNLEQDWIVTTLSDRANPEIEKSVVYAFPSLPDISAIPFAQLDDLQIVAFPLPVTHILFQLISLETVDSLVFFETPGDFNTGIEIKREDLQSLVQTQLKRSSFTPITPPNQLPPDIA